MLGLHSEAVNAFLFLLTALHVNIFFHVVFLVSLAKIKFLKNNNNTKDNIIAFHLCLCLLTLLHEKAAELIHPWASSHVVWDTLWHVLIWAVGQSESYTCI